MAIRLPLSPLSFMGYNWTPCHVCAHAITIRITTMVIMWRLAVRKCEFCENVKSPGCLWHHRHRPLHNRVVTLSWRYSTLCNANTITNERYVSRIGVGNTGVLCCGVERKQKPRAPTFEDDEDGHLIYQNGDVLLDRCSFAKLWL